MYVTSDEMRDNKLVQLVWALFYEQKEIGSGSWINDKNERRKMDLIIGGLAWSKENCLCVVGDRVE